jgi:hypothetical protein
LFKRRERVRCIAGREIADPTALGQPLQIARLECPHVDVGLDVAQITQASRRTGFAVMKAVPPVVAVIPWQQYPAVFSFCRGIEVVDLPA